MIRGAVIVARADKPICSLYQAGLSTFEALKENSKIDWTLIPVSTDADMDYNYLNSFDVLFCNFHESVWMDINPHKLKSLRGLKILYGFERKAFSDPWYIQGRFWDISPREIFNVIAIPDPNAREEENVLILPRLIRRFEAKSRPINLSSPVVSTFGILVVHKILNVLVQTMNELFDTATLRLNFPKGDHIPERMDMNLYSDISEVALNLKTGIKFEFTRNYMSSNELIAWLNQSDLNVFLYGIERDFYAHGNIPSSIDEAISAQRPIAVSQNLCVAHVMKYIAPMPQIDLKESLNRGVEPVLHMYNDWSPVNFVNRLDIFIEERV